MGAGYLSSVRELAQCQFSSLLLDFDRTKLHCHTVKQLKMDSLMNIKHHFSINFTKLIHNIFSKVASHLNVFIFSNRKQMETFDRTFKIKQVSNQIKTILLRNIIVFTVLIGCQNRKDVGNKYSNGFNFLSREAWYSATDGINSRSQI